MNLKQQLDQLGILYIPYSQGPFTSYFIKRSWGNYLIFPHPEVENLKAHMDGSGGIYKVIDLELPFPWYNKWLFDRYGASTIGPKNEWKHDFLIENVPENYYDVDLSLDEEASRIHLHYRQEKLIFLDLKGFNQDNTNTFPRYVNLQTE
jgi:hypothetical protein